MMCGAGMVGHVHHRSFGFRYSFFLWVAKK